MKRLASTLSVILLVTLAVSACGGSSAPAQDAPASPTKTPATKVGTPRPPTVTPVPGGPMSGKKTLANGVWMCPMSTAGAQFVGGQNDKEFHKLDCPSAADIPILERICFLDDKVAIKFGHQPAKDCSP